jgi:hypothetical protein
LRYWAKHHGALSRLAARSLMMFHHLLRYGLMKTTQKPLSSRRDALQPDVNVACLRALFSGMPTGRAGNPVGTSTS